MRLDALVRSGATADLDWRLDQLAAVRDALVRGEVELTRALRADLGKPVVETTLFEIGVVVSEIDDVRRNLARWVRADAVRAGAAGWPGRAAVERCPVGVVLVVAPWNYPIYLCVLPAVSALAAGNCVVVKPSERAPASGAVLARLLGDASHAVVVVEGGPEVVHDALEAGVDHVLFTGSAAAGRAVAEAAGRRLVPVTLELGGKCPAIVDASAHLPSAARRIAWGKFANAGQTCVAPDYVLVEESVADRFTSELCSALVAFYGSDAQSSPDYGRVVDTRELDRITALLEGHGGTVVTGGRTDRADRYLEPTVVRQPSLSSRLMQEEIFGPVLPVVGVAGTESARAVVASLPDPLAVYVFSRDSAAIARLRDGTRSGGFFVNVATSQQGIAGLAMGGVGASGSGAYRGRAGIETLSRHRSVYTRPVWPDLAVHHPPYGWAKSRLLRRLLHLPGRPVPRGSGRPPTGRS